MIQRDARVEKDAVMLCQSIHQQARRPWLAALLIATAISTSGCHCVTSASHAVPASRLDPHIFGEIREAQVPILFSALGQERPQPYRVGPGDTLAIFVYGVLPPSTDETPVLSQYQTLNQRYYPPHGSIVHPSTGLPMTVGADGALELPLIGRLPVAGLSLQEVSEKIREAYTKIEVIQLGRERITVSMITQRTHRIVVMRQDTPNPNVALTPPGVVDQIHRGEGEVIDLPAYENDVLHALAATGGLPGTDAYREVWVLRNSALNGTAGLNPDQLDKIIERQQPGVACNPMAIRIPLFMYPGEPLPFRPEDVVLNAGDVVYIPRRREYFYTGGLLNGAKIPLPVDEDLDVVEAVALSTGSVAGPLGQSGTVLAGGTPGWVVKPSRVLILRKMPDGTQLPIRVDLARAISDKKERILIRPDDVVMLNFKPGEGVLNTVLTMFNYSGNLTLVPEI
jgi:protein involved in polysaccharide export with SLBB domain